MIVVLVSECERAAWKRTRRIISKYGTQIGSRTWLARVSKEGLDGLRAELRQSASRRTAVSCHRVVGKLRTELTWIVGSRKKFTQTGEYPFSVTEAVVAKPIIEEPLNIRVVGYLTEIAALWHDFGKQSCGFQDVLRGKSKGTARPIRHERLSVQALLSLIESLLRKNETPIKSIDEASDLDWSKVLASEDTVRSTLDELWKSKCTFNSLNTSQNIENSFITPRLFRSDKPGQPSRTPPLFSSLATLILSHHKLPQADNNYDLIESGYVRNGLHEKTAYDEFLSFPQTFEPIWDSSNKWLERLCRLNARLHRLLADRGTISKAELSAIHLASHFYGRPALILADHFVSSQANNKFRGERQDVLCFANTTKSHGKHVLAQPLHEHLIEVARCSSKFYRYLLRLNRREGIPSVEETPSSLRSSLDATPFYWQETADEKIVEVGIEAADGFFGVIVAETGAGKTRGNARIMAALSKHEQLRFSVALGLRTLTLQTGKAFSEEMDLKDQTAVMVGSALARFLFERNQTVEEKDSSGGSESRDMDDEFYEGVQNTFDIDFDCFWPSEFAQVGSAKLNELLRAPILTCTIDHLIPAVQSNRSSAVALCVRLLSSDLVIDEIDSFNITDLVPIAKLCFLSGFYGGKLLISSATIPGVLASTLFESYLSGQNKRRALLDLTFKTFTGWFCHYSDEHVIKTTKNAQEFSSSHERFINDYVNRLGQAPAIRKVVVVDNRKNDFVDEQSLEEHCFASVLECAQDMHSKHRVKDTSTGVQYSIGAVRWNNVKVARAFTSFLVEKAPSAGTNSKCISLKVICYHAKHLPLILNEIEKTLQALLTNRKVSAENKILRRHLCAAREAGKEVLVLVSTSPICEVGRDHDFDWAIVEPCSYRSLIQMAGRVRRHAPRRQSETREANIAIMRHSLKGLNTLCSNQNDLNFYRPGPETKNLRLSDVSDSEPGNCLDVNQIFDIERLQERIDAFHMLKAPTNIPPRNGPFRNLFELEHARFLYDVKDKDDFPLAAYTEFEHFGGISSALHAIKNPFRDESAKELIWRVPATANEERKWKRQRKDEHPQEITRQVIESPPKKSSVFFFDQGELDPDLLEEHWGSILRDRGIDSHKIGFGFEDNRMEGDSLKGYVYDQQLGWYWAKT